MKLVHVVSFLLSHARCAGDALGHLRRLCARSDEMRCAMLLFCDLPDAPCQALPDEAAWIHSLLSGISALNAQAEDRFFLLVRRRVWDDASRQYLGVSQTLSPREVIAQLLVHGQSPAAFEAASLAPASMKKRWQAVLFSDFSAVCTPDVPQRMLRHLEKGALPAVGARVLPRRAYPHSVLARLCACAPFSLSPVHAAQEIALAQKGLAAAGQPILCRLEALSHIGDMQRVPLAPDCFFVRKNPPDMRSITLAYLRLCRMHPLPSACVPLLQLALFAASAFSGFSPLCAAALIPEIRSLLYPRAWPGVLLRTALLPQTAANALDVLLGRLFSRSPLLRLRVPASLRSPFACLFAAGALLPAAVLSVHALAAVLPVLLFWLSAPLWYPALGQMTIERIPLDDGELSQLRTLAEIAYWDAAKDAAPASGMLTACAGCMLGLLDPDEAARQIQTLSRSLPADPDAPQQASLLVCAQYLREHMHACDAALRPLPAQLESQALASPAALPSGTLGRLLHAVHTEQTPDFVGAARTCVTDQLFLPLGPCSGTTQHPLSLPLTHPHTFLSLLPGISPASEENAADRFLFLAAAALGHPFHALLLRSPIAGPYAALL